MLTLDGYTDVERIGHGGLGDVYRATRVSTGHVVAVKVLRDVSDESVAWNRTRRELTALVSLGGHAHVIRLLELLDDTPGLVMEYAPGGSIAQLLEHRALSIGEIALVGRHTASALAAAHERGIVHRDVKPQNLLVDAYGQVKLCDFGIASLARTEEFRTRTSAISMRYASPEDLEDAAEVGPASDVYSLGATLLHLAHGAPPTLKERLAPWVPPPTDDTELAALNPIIAACLHPDPSVRPTAVEVLERLEALESELAERCRALQPAHGVVDPATSTAPDTSAGPSAVVSEVGVAPAGDAAPVGAPPPSHEQLPGHDGLPGVEGTVRGPTDDDATLFRTGRRPPPASVEPPAPSRRPRWPAFVTGVLVVLAVVVVWQVLRADDADAPATPPTDGAERDGIAVVARPDGLVDLDDASITWPFGPVGECLVQVGDELTLGVVDCAEPHDLQRVATGRLPDELVSTDRPDDDLIERAVAERCAEVTLDATELELRMAQTRPSADTWRDGDRAYQCLVGVPGARLTGDALAP